MPIVLHRSNSLTKLAEHFRDAIAHEPLPPMEEETVLVQSIGMGRWLSLAMAEAFGAWASFRYIYPNVFLDIAFSAADERFHGEHLVKKDWMRWRIFEILPSLAKKKKFAPLKGYAADENRLKQFQLSGKIADCFDQYLTARPDMICAWDRKDDSLIAGQTVRPLEDDEIWQSELWRMLSASSDKSHRARIREQLLNQGFPLIPAADMPKRISVFGVSTLFPFHLDILKTLESHIDIQIYLVSPSREYIADILPVKARGRLLRRLASQGVSEENMHIDAGHPLIASMGSLARDFQGILLEKYIIDADHDIDKTTDADFIIPGDDTLLHMIQSDIITLRTRDTKGKVSDDDRSVTVNIHYGPRREVEGLYDWLLGILDTHSDLHPRDILVMTSDIDQYAPYIESVFGADFAGHRDDTSGRMIPYSIADRNVRAQSAVARDLRKILTLDLSRFAVSEIIDIFKSPPVRAKFKFNDDELTRIERWIEEAGIRWGRDENDRDAVCGVSFREYSWEYGIDRLLLGYAIRHEGMTLYREISPAPSIEGSDAELLGRFISAYRMLEATCRAASADHTIGEWFDLLTDSISSIFEESSEYAWEFDAIRTALKEMASSARDADFTGKVPRDVALEALFGGLEERAVQYGFLNGRVTFCAMLPMRSVPFRVICVLGLDDGKFPDSSRVPSFDLTGKRQMTGDRSKRNDDRYIFLETVMSARDYLYLSYNGRSPHDNTVLSPSVVVREFEEYIRDSYTTENGTGDDLLSSIRVTHRLHPFSREYFSGEGKLFSYSSSMCEIAKRSTEVGSYEMFQVPLRTEIPQSFMIVSVEDLKYFYVKPVRFFCERRLGIRFPRVDGMFENDEPFEIPFENRIMAEELFMERAFSGDENDDIIEWASHAGIIPPAIVGRYELEKLSRKVTDFAETVAPFTTGIEHKLRADIGVNTSRCELRINGEIGGIYENTAARYRISRWPGDFLSVWIEHLFLAASGNGVRMECVFGEEKWSFPIIERDEAMRILSTLAETYCDGLTRPLKLFPKCSIEYMNELAKKGNRSTAISKARETWQPNEFREGRADCEDPYHIICFGNHPEYHDGTCTIDEEFEIMTINVYGPLMAARGAASG
jgi:exodeoxyribonuclease V gamma subunit